MIIKPINTPLQIKQVAQVEAETWGLNPSDTVPDHVLTAIAYDGGVLLGAYDRGDQLIGFTLGWLGTTSQECEGKFHSLSPCLDIFIDRNHDTLT